MPTLPPDTLELSAEHEGILEELLDTEGDAEDAYHRLADLALSKIDLNRATEDDLAAIPGVTPVEAARIVRIRRRNGAIRSFDDILSAGLDSAAIAALRPFVTLRTRSPVSIRAEVTQRWMRRLERARAYESDSSRTGFNGSPDALLTRVRLEVGDRLRLGATVEKDAGEQLRVVPTRPDLGFDFATWYALASDVGPFRRVYLGDFSATAGEGLLLGQSTSSRTASQPGRPRELLRPHTSSREYAFFRGIGARTHTWNGLTISAFASRRYVDARFDSTDGSWSFTVAGLHRTPSEIARRNAVHETAIGWLLRCEMAGFTAGVIGASTVSRASGATVRRHRGLSGYLTKTTRRFSATVETTRRASSIAVSGSLIYRPTGELRFWLSGFSTSEGSLVPHTFLGASTRGEGRREIFWSGGIRIRPAGALMIEATSQRRAAPRHVLEAGTIRTAGVVAYAPRRWLDVRVRGVDAWSEHAAACTKAGMTARCMQERRRRTIRLQIDYVHSPSFRNRIRIERSTAVSRPAAVGGLSGRTRIAGSAAAVTAAAASDERRTYQGVLLYEDFRWRPLSFLRVDARVLFFDVNDFAARLYAYENDVGSAFSAPLFSGRGRRQYVLATVTPHPSLFLQAKIATTVYEDVQHVGSGLGETAGRRLTDVRLQLRWRLD